MPAATPAPVVLALAAALGSSVVTDASILRDAQADKSGHRSAAPPLAVVTARTVAEVQQTLRIASAHGTPVVTRGAGTGLAGGAIGSAGEIVLSTLAMDRLLEVNAADELAVVEPGIINAALNEQLAPHGLWFTPDPASRAISTVGGNIATNAGGLLCAKYGVTRDSVLGLRVVLADGRLLELGHRSVKGVTGLDLTALMVGSEGTLGVIVEATVRLRRLVPGVTPTIGAYFADVRAAAAAAAAVTAAGIRPAVMELVDAASLDAIGALLGLPLRERGAAYLLVQTDGAGAEAEAAQLLALLAAAGGTAELTTDAAEAARLLEVRRAMHPAMERLGTTLIEDVAVPRSALPAMFDAIAAIERKYGMVIPTIAHAGDGNLHPNFVFEGPDVPEHVWEAADEMFQAAIALGGTLTGEHGIGLLKRRWLRGELGDEQFELQQQIKRVFDPAGILNPGKVF
ncbi:FAD-binding oxidoreductase [Microterricola pindariensis]|uniref:FAD-binding oxidoreductase n=1 Tax=Microterricola pindariensis TaxID=478010 RepID=A0ABX5AZR7_9MICO|nr:FAD-linked oxidase C-terminal domain-containing protein [Microterricola pindariensis]PPL20401.1 FAD-binding oxidoreductase [Microterricola pindariensis]